MSVSVIPDFDDAVDTTLESAPIVEPERLSDSRADVPISETSERFLRALLLQVPIERIVELHLFAPLRQGAVETGIAVVAARVNEPRVDATYTEEEPVATSDLASEIVLEEDSPYAPEPELGAEPLEAIDVLYDIPAPIRLTVYTARYRLVIKGPDRGKWEIDVVDEADAPLLAIESVVRGVQRRAGEETATVRYDAGQLSRALRLQPTVGQ